MAIDSGIAPITPHMYITRVLDDDNEEDGAAGLAAGISLLYRCDVIIVGDKYGISEGMHGKIQEARRQGVPIVDAEASTSVDDFIDKVHTAVKKNHFLLLYERGRGYAVQDVLRKGIYTELCRKTSR